MEQTQKPTSKIISSSQEPEWIVWVMLVILLAAGILLKNSLENQTVSIQANGLTLTIPSDWQASSKDQNKTAIRYVAPLSNSFFHPGIQVISLPKSDFSKNLTNLYDISMEWGRRKSEAELSYRNLEIEELTIAGKNSIRMDFTYVAEPPADSPASLPVVVEGRAYLMESGEDVKIIDFSCDSLSFPSTVGILDRIITSLKME